MSDNGDSYVAFSQAANTDILNFLFATTSPWKSLKKVVCRQAALLAEAVLARHRATCGDAR